ncbi:unnamed protein product [Ectocarpus fasciculatus]
MELFPKQKKKSRRKRVPSLPLTHPTCKPTRYTRTRNLGRLITGPCILHVRRTTLLRRTRPDNPHCTRLFIYTRHENIMGARTMNATHAHLAPSKTSGLPAQRVQNGAKCLIYSAWNARLPTAQNTWLVPLVF